MAASRLGFGLFLLAHLGVEALAQDPSLHASRVGAFWQPGAVYADIWADGDFVYLGRYGQARIDILDLSTPSNPTLAATYAIAAPNDVASAQDLKVAGGLLFIALESGGPDGVAIVDVRDPYNPTLLTLVDTEPGPFENIHNVFYAEGWLYICDSSNPVIALVDMRSYDPDAPPARITTWDHNLSGVGSLFVHDITVQNGRMWASAWDGTYAFDVSDLDAGPPRLMGSTLGVNAHASWPTSDGRFLVSAEERGGGSLRLFEVLDDGVGIELVQWDSYCSPRSGASSTFSAHNPVLVGDRIYLSNYSAGVLVLEIDRTSRTLEVVASYDTSIESPANFAGCWGVYPLLGPKRVVASDIESGLHVLDMSALALSTPQGRPFRSRPGEPQAVTLRIDELGRSPASVQLFVSLDGAAYTASPMSDLGSGQFLGALPSAPCGSRIDYYFSAQDTLGSSYTKPAAAAASPFTAWVTGGLAPVLVDDFEADTGWSVADFGVSIGSWERVDPIGSGAAPAAGRHYQPSGRKAFITGQGSPGQSAGAADLDGGPTRLTSPPLDFSSGDGLIRYSRWLFNDDVDSDGILAEISGDGGVTWTTLENATAKAGGWVERAFRVSDFVTPSAQVVVRFSASDAPNNSITEAGIDEFRAELFACPVPSLASATSRNGSGTNPEILRATSLPLLGHTWTSELDTTPVRNASASLLFAFDRPLAGVPSPFGEVLVAFPTLGGKRVFATLVSPTRGIDRHSVWLPNDLSLTGMRVFTQGAVLGPPIRLTNAIDLVLGH